MIAKVKAKLPRFRKAVAPAIAVLAQPAMLSLLHGNALVAVEAVISVATLAGVYQVPPNAAV